MEENKTAIKTKTSMSVREMGESLGLKKVDSYELVKKNYFETRKVAGKYRVMIASFDDWYSKQFRYRKIDGTQPGNKYGELYFAEDICDMFDIARLTAKDLMRKHFPDSVITIEQISAVDKRVFEAWYNQQYHYIKVNGELPYVLQNCKTMSAHEMCDLLGIRLRNAGYSLTSRGYFKTYIIDGSLRIDIKSFEEWYKTQTHYVKVHEKEDIK